MQDRAPLTSGLTDPHRVFSDLRPLYGLCEPKLPPVPVSVLAVIGRPER
jgi:hypothetical protein